MVATIKFDQSGKPAGLDNRSRSDIDAGTAVTITNVSPGSVDTIALLWKPPEDDTSAITGSSPTWSITPKVGTSGSYRIKLTVDGLISIHTFAVRTPARSLVIPAANEKADPDADLTQQTSVEIDASETNEVFAPFTSGSAFGWWKALEECIRAIDLDLGGDVTGPGSATDNAVIRFDGVTGKIIQNSGVTIDDTDNLDMNAANIGNVGTVDGINVSAHDHGVGGGATVDHVNLSNKGTNTHVQIDSHLASTANPHATDIGNLGSGTLAELNIAITDATLDDSSSSRTPTAHATSHESGGGDIVAHQNLSGAGTNTHAQIDTHIATVSGNPHVVTKGDVGLGNVTNDAQVKKIVSSTDHAVMRWDGITGDTPQNSVVIIDDLGNVNLGNGTISNLGATGGIVFIDDSPSQAFIGIGAGNKGTSTSYAIALGNNALRDLTSGTGNVAIGGGALQKCTIGNFNMAIGTNALIDLIDGNSNVAVGNLTLENVTSGGANVGIGYEALQQVTTQSYNVGVGPSALAKVISNNNTGIGDRAGSNINTGEGNTIIGRYCGIILTSGSRNIIIGKNIDASAAGVDDELNIGNTIYGDLSSGKVRIGGTGAISQTGVLSLEAGALEFADMSAPSNPGAGRGVVYKKTGDDGLFYKPDAAGPEVDLTAGSDVNDVRSTQQTTDAVQATFTGLTKTIGTNTIKLYRVFVTAKNTGNTFVNAYTRTVRVHRFAAGAVLGKITADFDDEDDAALDMTCDVNVNDLRVRITGKAATTVDWIGRIVDVTELG